MNERAMELSALVRTVAFAGRGAADEWVRNSGLTRQQAFALGYIDRFQENGVIARDLAQMSGTTPASVTSLVQGLESRGLVERKPSPTDSRVKLIFTTQAGSDAVSGFEDDMRAAQSEVFAPLSNEEQETLLGLLRRVAAEQPDPFADGPDAGFGPPGPRGPGSGYDRPGFGGGPGGPHGPGGPRGSRGPRG